MSVLCIRRRATGGRGCGGKSVFGTRESPSSRWRWRWRCWSSLLLGNPLLFRQISSVVLLMCCLVSRSYLRPGDFVYGADVDFQNIEVGREALSRSVLMLESVENN